MPRVTVILPVRDGMPHLGPAVESILVQTFQDFELIVIDDASTDSTPDYLAGLGDPRVRVIRNQRNRGVARSLNKALRLATGHYIARQDADDISLPRRLEKQVALLDSRPHVGWAGTDWTIVDKKGVAVVERVGVPCSDIDIKWQLLFSNPICHTSVLARKSAVEAAGRYPEDPDCCLAEDYALWSRLARMYDAASLPEPLVKWRFTSDSISSRRDASQLEQAARISLGNVSWVMDRDALSSSERQAFQDANMLFRSVSGHDPQLSPARLRAAVGFLHQLQRAFYARYRFSRSEVAAHQRHWYWIWGRHLLALSLRSRASVANKLTYAGLGACDMVRLAASVTRSVRQPQGKRVLICSQFLTVGGVETHIVNLCRLLVENGAEVTVVTRVVHPRVPAVDELRSLPVRFLATPFRHGGRASTLWAMAFWSLRLSRAFDVLYTFDMTWFAAFLARFVRPRGYVLGAGWGPARPGAVQAAALEVLDGVLLETKLQAEPYRDLLPAGAIPHLACVTEAGPRRLRRVDELRVAFLGRMDRNKGMHALLDLWPGIDIQPARLDFYGDGWEFEHLESKIRTHGLANVHLHGAFTSTDLPKIFEQTDLVVLPSEREGLPLVLMEAMAYGVPFVATDVGAIRTLAENNPDVCVVPFDDTALKRGIERMARAIRDGQIDGRRLQRYHRERYGYDLLAARWLRALLRPEEFWQGGGLPGRDRWEGSNRPVEEPVGDAVRT